MRSDLQQLVDSLAERVGFPTQLTDAQLGSVVFGPHPDNIDWIRRETLLLRRTPPEVRSFLEQFGLVSATRPFRIPSDPVRGVMSRVVVPVRSHGLTYGYLWFLDDDRLMSESQVGDAVEVAAEIGQVLYLDQLVRQVDSELVRDLLADVPEVRQHAIEQTLNRNLIPPRASIAVALVLHPAVEPGRALDLPVKLDAGLRRRHGLPVSVLLHTEASHTVLVIPVGEGDPHGTARAVAKRARELCVEAGGDQRALVVGVGDPQPELGQARESYRQAGLAARVARLPGEGPIAEWRHLGVYRALTSIPADRLDTAALDPRVRTILDNADSSLITTLEAYFDSACDIKLICELLNVHRGTVYYRLRKAEAISGLDLGNGMDRLALHLGIKIAHLAGLRSEDGGS